MLRYYRTYRYGVRLTVKCRTAREAKARMKDIIRDYPKLRNAKRMRERPDLGRTVFLSAPSLEILDRIEG